MLGPVCIENIEELTADVGSDYAFTVTSFENFEKSLLWHSWRICPPEALLPEQRVVQPDHFCPLHKDMHISWALRKIQTKPKHKVH